QSLGQFQRARLVPAERQRSQCQWQARPAKGLHHRRTDRLRAGMAERAQGRQAVHALPVRRPRRSQSPAAQRRGRERGFSTAVFAGERRDEPSTQIAVTTDMDRPSFSRQLKLYVLICAASVCLYGLSAVHSAGRDEQRPALAQAEQLFVERIAPTLAAKCRTCHGEDAAAGLDLRSRESALKGGERGAAIIPGDAEKSLLYLALLGRDGFKRMPPGSPLADDLIAAFKQWIDAGAPWVERRKEAAALVAEAKWTYAEDDVWAFKPVKLY